MDRGNLEAMLIWVYSLNEVDKLQCRSLLDGLHSAGIETKEYDWTTLLTPGVVLFDQSNKEACDFIRHSSHGGAVHLLAVALSRAALKGGGAWSLLHAGASDVIVWENCPDFVTRVAAYLERWQTVDRLIESPLVRENLIGSSPAWIRVLRQVVEVARFTSAYVLVTGESGTGKELVARLIHTLDPRPRKGNLVILDCTTVVPELSGSEFFGHERGAFTGAVSSRDGAFALANGGTLFLDEVGELPQSLQAELLRVVQEHTYKRVGSNTWHKTEFRLVSATNRQLLCETNHASFRPDLYYRIASWSCHLPSLHERREDILPLAFHFSRQAWEGAQDAGLNEDVLEYLMSRAYPGNIRELKQLILRMVYRHVGPGPLTPGDIPEGDRPEPSLKASGWQDQDFERVIRRAVAMGAKMREISRAAEDIAVRSAVAEERGSWSQAAARLGVTGRALQLRRAAWRRKAQNNNDLVA